jgi:hypothetical protein
MKMLALCSAATLVLTTAACGSGGGSSGTHLPANEVAVTPVGTARGAAVQQLVLPAGATIGSADGRLQVDVPPGALASPQTLTIQAITNEAPGGVGTAYRLGPEGATFSSPVGLTWSYTSSDVVGSDPLALKIAYQDSQGRWNAVKSLTLDTAAKTISVRTSHFSDWSALAGFQLRPGTASVRAGGSVDLVVDICSNAVSGTDELSELLNRCRPDPDFFTVQQWSVNGAVNGNTTVGTLRASSETSATYVAPASAPASNPVAVSASVTDQTSQRKTILTSNVFIDAKAPLTGTILSTQQDQGLGFTLSTRANLAFEYDLTNQWYQPKPGGALHAGYEVVADGCVTRGTLEAAIAPTDGMIIVTDLGYFPSGRTMGTFTGATTCASSPGSEPFSLTEEVQWWPTAVESIFTVKPDGSLSEVVSYVVADTNQRITTDWTLVPLASP